MNEMAMVEYLLKLYAARDKELRYFCKSGDNDVVVYHLEGAQEETRYLFRDRFGMTIRETDTEYIAENRVCSVRVRKE